MAYNNIDAKTPSTTSSTSSWDYIQVVCDEITKVLGPNSALTPLKSGTHPCKISAHNKTMRLLPLWIGDDIYLVRLFDEYAKYASINQIHSDICIVEHILSCLEKDEQYDFSKMIHALPKELYIDERLQNYFNSNAEHVSIHDNKLYAAIALRRLLVQMYGQYYIMMLARDRCSLIHEYFFDCLAKLFMSNSYLLDTKLTVSVSTQERCKGKNTVGDLNGHELILTGIQEFGIEFASIRTLKECPTFFLLSRREQNKTMEVDLPNMFNNRTKKICSLSSWNVNVPQTQKQQPQPLLQSDSNSSSSSSDTKTTAGSDLKEMISSLKHDNIMLSLNLSYAALETAEIKLIAEMLITNTTLTTLDISNHKISLEGAKHLAHALTINKTLTHLKMNNSQIGPEGAAEIARALTTNTTLEALALTRSGIHSDGAVAMADMLTKNRSLRYLDIGFNGIHSIGEIALLNAMRANTTLYMLNFTSEGFENDGGYTTGDAPSTSEISAAIAKEIDDICLENRSGERCAPVVISGMQQVLPQRKFSSQPTNLFSTTPKQSNPMRLNYPPTLY